MLSKLTFSLASLIILLMVAVCLPVGAQKISSKSEVLLQVPASPATSGIIAVGDGMDSGFIVYGKTAITDVGQAGIASAVTYWAGATDAAGGLLPDLEDFFRFGGTIELLAKLVGDGADAAAIAADDPKATKGLKAKDIVISEVMWALDVDGDRANDDTRNQWIELYNTKTGSSGEAVAIGAADDTAAAGHEMVTSGDLALLFTPFVHLERLGSDLKDDHSVTTVAADKKWKVIDTVSNLQFVRWDLPGQSGNSTEPRAGQALDPPIATLISTYRNIDYVKVHGIHKLNPNNTVNTGPNRTEQLKGVPDGWLQGSWKATQLNGRRNTQAVTSATPLTPAQTTTNVFAATPGHAHVMDVVFSGVTKTSIPSNSVVINEVRNDSSPANVDWVELYNAGTEAVGLRDWELSLIHKGSDGKLASSKTDTMLVGKEDGGDDDDRFPANDVFKLMPGEYLLIVNRHPKDTPLANGLNIDEAAEGTNVNAGASHQYIVREKLDLPGHAVTLILRNALDKNSHHKGDNLSWNTSLGASEKIMDYAGTVSIAVHNNAYNTLVWPFRGWTKTAGTDGKDGKGIPANSTQAHARKRYQANDGHHKDAWDHVGAKGGLGYDRGVDLKYAPGTPGYANDGIRDQLVDDKDTTDATDDVIFSGEVSISEIMYDAGPRWNLIQWIELYNSSMSEAVNLKDWELEIRNATDDVNSYVDSGLKFNDAHILPNQTLLLVSGTGTNDVAGNRVYNLYQHHRRELGLTNRRSVLLSPEGFFLKLMDKNGDEVDAVGNVMVQGAQRNVQWDLYDVEAEDIRRSIVRQYGDRTLYDGTSDSADPGTMMDSWRQSDIAGAGISFYGHRDDVGTPGYRLGGPLPVSLSKFRPVRNQETGHVDITWITESELNNAGFNILRAESKTGEFKVVNVKGIIAGHGTTSEQHVYKFTDTNTKPNVVYYYQIEDVSINGLRTTLTTTHLRGHVGAAGKLTTTWGDLKLQK